MGAIFLYPAVAEPRGCGAGREAGWLYCVCVPGVRAAVPCRDHSRQGTLSPSPRRGGELGSRPSARLCRTGPVPSAFGDGPLDSELVNLVTFSVH